MLMASWKVAPALAAGCSVVLKPSEVTPLTALEFGETSLPKAGLPAGASEHCHRAWARMAGAPLAEHPGVDKLAFTGSVPTGSRIMAAAARDVKTISPGIGWQIAHWSCLPTHPSKRPIEWIMFGIFWNQGEVCSATSRVLIEAPIYDAVMAAAGQSRLEKIKIGHGSGRWRVLLGPAGQPKRSTTRS